MREFPEQRIRKLNSQPVRTEGDYVLYWMTSFRRPRFNFALQRAIDWSVAVGKPLLVLEALRLRYRWASDRFHTFVMQGMHDNLQALRDCPVTYYPYVERQYGEGRGLVARLADRSAIVVTDDFPCFFIPRMLARVANRFDCAFEAVDANGILPLQSCDRVFTTAYSFRRYLQRALPPHLRSMPVEDPFAGQRVPPPIELAADVVSRWPLSDQMISSPERVIAELPIDHSVGSVAARGGHLAAGEILRQFIETRLPRYADSRNDPEDEAASQLSPYLHFGHIATHEVFHAVVAPEDWSVDELPAKGKGQREGWWQLSPAAEAFLDELITWREIGFNMCAHRGDYDQYESLPDWAKKTLAEHAEDRRETLYSLEELERSQTHDEIWNAAQRQLVREGRIHNYLRMLWGKKVLEWSPSPQIAAKWLIHLNNKYALDGRDPNSYSGIFWVLGRYDRAWGPERPIFGKIRFMSSDSTRRKLKLKGYLRRYAESEAE